MDSARKAEIRARLAAATPLPWDLRFNANGEGELFGDDHNTWLALLPHGCVARLEEQMHKDAAFIAAAPTDVADLLAEVERLEAALEEAERLARGLETSFAAAKLALTQSERQREEAERKLAMIENRMRERYLFTPEGMEAHMGGDYVSWLRLIQVFQPKFEVAAEKGGDDA